MCFAGKCQAVVMTGLVLGFFFFRFHGFGVADDKTSSFVTVSGTHFQADCRPFFLVGFNTHDLVQAASMTPYEYRMKNGKSGRSRVRAMFREASESGLNVLRTWVHTNDAKFPFQKAPGEYEESTLRSLDYILDEARKYGIRVILSFVDNWKYYNGVDQYVDWSPTVPARTMQRPKDQEGDPSPLNFENEEIKLYEVQRHARFFTDVSCKIMYKHHVQAVVNRRNHANGALYKNDPTILAWDLINEPRCETWAVPECETYLQAWLEEMSAFLRSEDPNHLITVGSEGFFGADSEYARHNPQDWGSALGQDWIRNHAIKNIDFATVHLWPNNWNRSDLAFQAEWLASHIEASARFQKPVLIEEFGKKVEVMHEKMIESLRDPVFQQTYAIVERSIKEGSNVQGSLFWRWNMPLYNDNERGEYGVIPSDACFKHVKMHSEFVHYVNSALPPAQSCWQECWVPVRSPGARRCVQEHQRCQSFSEDFNSTESQLSHLMMTSRGSVNAPEAGMYPSKKTCCLPGLGAFAAGCSWFTM